MLDQIEQIGVTKVADELRLNVLPKHFGSAFLSYEHAVYTFMRRLCEEYYGGYWEFNELSNGGIFMELDDEMRFTLNSPNGSSFELSAMAASIVANLFAQGYMMQKYETEELIDKYHQLIEFASQLDEAEQIFQLID